MTTVKIREVPPGARGPLLSLLLLADDSSAEVARYVDRGRLFVLDDPEGEALPHHQALALALVTEGSQAKRAELRSIAVAEPAQRRGHGRRLVNHVLQLLRDAGIDHLEVATATCDLTALTFYLRLGFRPFRIDRDYFTPERGYPSGVVDHGIQLRDRIWLDAQV